MKEPAPNPLPLRIVVEHPLPGVALAVQLGKDMLLQPTLSTREATTFDFEIRAILARHAPRLLGTAVQGPPAGRFVYVCAGKLAGQAESSWVRRAKVPLSGITRALVRAQAAEPGSCLEARISGIGRDGGPAAGTVQIGPKGWQLVSAAASEPAAKSTRHAPPAKAVDEEAFLELVRAIIAGERKKASRLMAAKPELVQARLPAGATRKESDAYFFKEILHYVYEGDTLLHMAAAAFQWEIAQDLMSKGASCSVKNRRKAEPLHYAADANTWNPTAQATTIECLIRNGANPNAMDANGASPIHRAVRTRSAAAVHALLAGGADPLARNRSGSTPLHLAVQNTGHGGSGEPRGREQQEEIILLLLQHGAKTTDQDASGKTVDECVPSEWVRSLLHP